MNITNLYISGLNTYQVVVSDYDAATQTYTFLSDTPRVQLLGQYTLESTVVVGGLPIKMTGDGFLDMTMIDGRSIMSFNFGSDSNGKLTMESFTFKNMTCGEFQSRNTGFMNNVNFSTFLNSVLENGMALVSSENELVDFMTSMYSKMMLETFNPMLKMFTSVDQLTTALIAATGNATTGVVGLPLCQ
ncbi:hypothetical protein ACFFRR_006983 [Megaselia abdita]